MSLAARSAIALAASIADPPPSATTTVPSRPTARSVVAPSSTVAPDGFGSTSLNIVASIEAASRTSSASAAMPRDDDARIGDKEGAGAMRPRRPARQPQRAHAEHDPVLA